MRVATGAQRLDAAHAMALVEIGRDRILADRLPEARPTRSRIEFVVGAEELGPAADAAVHAFLLAVVVLAAECSLRRLLAGHRVLLRGERPSPFVLGLEHLVAHGLPPAEPLQTALGERAKRVRVAGSEP
jgi:hypothetical protein